MEFQEAVRARRSIRCFKSDPVSEEILERILEAVRAAPSWANVQPWEIVIVADKELRRQLKATVSKGNPSLEAVVEAPRLLCLVGITGVSGWYKGKAVTDRGDWMLFDNGIAAEHLALAAAAEGMGTVHVGYFDYKKAGEILKLGESRTVIELIPLGRPESVPKPVDRKPLKDFVFKDAHGVPYFEEAGGDGER